MDIAWWGIVAVLVVGVAVVAYGWLSDRRVTRQREQELAAAPGDGPVPAYVTGPPRSRPSTELDDRERDALRQQLRDAATVAAGRPADDFVTDPTTGWSVLRAPSVLVCADEVTDVRDLIAVIRRLEPDRPPLVVVAPAFGPTLLRTLAANAAHQAFVNLPIALDGAGRETVCAATGAEPIAPADLHAGYVPADALGTCQAWVADEHTSWIVSEGRS